MEFSRRRFFGLFAGAVAAVKAAPLMALAPDENLAARLRRMKEQSLQRFYQTLDNPPPTKAAILANAILHGWLKGRAAVKQRQEEKFLTRGRHID